jgi:predicted DNA-binding transcriptional regulator AlpA
MATLYDQINKNEFPEPNVQVGLRAVGWTEDILEKEQARRIAKRNVVVAAGRAA